MQWLRVSWQLLLDHHNNPPGRAGFARLGAPRIEFEHVRPAPQLASNRLPLLSRGELVRTGTPADGASSRRGEREEISSSALWCHISASASSRQLSRGRNTAL